MKKKKQEIYSPDYYSFETTSFENQMGEKIGSLVTRGYELASAPVLTAIKVPFGFNDWVGRYPHFLILMKKKPTEAEK